MNDLWYVYVKIWDGNELEKRFPSRLAAIHYMNEQIAGDNDDYFIIEISLSVDSKILFHEGRDDS